MKKLFTLVLIVFLGTVSEAQPAYYNHNTTTGGANVFPFNTNPATGKRVQWVITAAGSVGGFNLPSPAPAGNNITSLWFWSNSASNGTYNNLTIRMATVSTSTFFSTGAFYTGPMTTVRQQNTTIVSAGANTWVNIPLTTPYLYDPSMNLIIEVSQCGFTGTGFNLRQLPFGAAPNYRRQYSDATSPCGAVALPTGGDLNVAGIGISVIPAIPCPTPADQPTGLNLTPVNVVQIDGSFTAALSSPTNYLVVRYLSGATPTNPANATIYNVGASLGAGTVVSTSSSTSFSAAGLTPNTAYDFYVYSYNTGLCGAAYNTTSPLMGTASTPPCTGPPGITCPANITVSNTTGFCSAIVNYPPATSSAIPAPTITYSQASGTSFPVGTTTVTATATHPCGVSTCSFTITVIDNQPPAFGFALTPERLYYKFDGSGTSIPNLATAPPPGTSTATIIGGLTQGTSPLCGTGSLKGNGGVSTTNYVNTGWATNLSGSWTISFKTSAITPSATLFYIFGDAAAGTFRCFTNGVAGANNWMIRGTGITDCIATGGATVAPHTTTFVYDNVAGNIKAYVDGILKTTVAQATPITNSSTGPFQVGGYATNTGLPANGLMDEFSFYTRALNASEVLTIAACPVTSSCQSIVRNNDPGVCGATVSFATPAASDNCPGVSVSQIAGLPSGSVFPIGVTTNTFQATDAAGNTAVCSFTVTVTDAQAPSISCPANATRTTAVNACTYTASGTEFDATVSDNCPGVTKAYTLTGATTGTGTALAGKAFNTGVTNVTWIATDAYGNTSSCSFTVTLNDGSLPIVTQPSTQTVCEGTNTTFTVVGTAGATLTYQWQQWNGTAWVNIAGATNASYTINSVTIAMNTNSFRVTLTTVCNNSITSALVSLYVRKLPVIELTTSRSPALIPGQFLTITANVNPGGGSIVWRKNGNIIAPPPYDPFTYPNLTVDDIGTYTATYTDQNGCSQTSGAISITAKSYDKLFVYPNPNDGQFQIRFYNQAGQAVTVNIYDERGARVYQRSLVTGPLSYSRIDVDLRKLQTGVYIVELRDASGNRISSSKRFIIGH